MTVAELIGILQRFPQDATVLVDDWNEDYAPPLELPARWENGKDSIVHYPEWNEVVIANVQVTAWWHNKRGIAQPIECEVGEADA